MKLYLVRHGETEINRLGGRFQGASCDVSLNETGKEQAALCGADFEKRGVRFDRVICSPLQRALETGELLTGLKRENFTIDPRLTEQDFGIFDGKTWDSMDPRTFRALMHDPENFYPPQGSGCESLLSVVRRTGDFLESLRGAELRYPGNTLICAHGGTLRAMLVNLHALKFGEFWNYPMGNCSWYEVSVAWKKYVITDRHET